MKTNFSRTRRNALLFAAVLACIGSEAQATIFTYNRTTSNTAGTADQWSAGTNWGATPVSAPDTTLTLGNGASLAAGATIFTNNDFAGDFKLNILNFNYTGPLSGAAPVVTISGNRLEFINDGATAPIINLDGGGAVRPFLTISNALLLTNNLTVTGSSSAALTGVISGTGSLTKTGPVANSGALTLSGANTFSGGVTLTRGTLYINNGGTSSTNSALGTGTFTINDSTVIANRSGQPVTVLTNNAQIWAGTVTFDAGGGAPGINSLNLGTGAVTLTGNREVNVSGADGLFGSATFTVGGAISDGGSGFSLTKTGIGTLVLTGVSTYSGGTTIAQGGINVATIGNAGAAGSVGTGGITINDNTTLRYIGAGETTNKVLNYGGSFMQLEQAGTGPLTFSADMTATSAGDKTLFLSGGSVSTGAGEIASHIFDYGAGNQTNVYLRNGSWILSGANSYTGKTTIAGTLIVSSINSVVGGAPSSNLGAPSNAGDGAIDFIFGGGPLPTLQYIGTGETTDRVINIGAGGPISSAQIAQEGTGLLKFTSNLLPNTTTFGQHDLVLSGSTSGRGEFAGLLFDQDTAANKITGVQKFGTGTWTLSANNTYTGTTKVFDGTLLINGNQAGATGGVEVFSTTTPGQVATLGGTGTIGGAVVVSGGKITAADAGSVGVLNLNGNATFVGAFVCPECGRPEGAPQLPSSPAAEFVLATYVVDLSGAFGDKLVIGGTLDLSDPNDQIVFNGTPDGSTTYVLATYSNVIGAFDFGAAPSGYQLVYGANELSLIVVPEPATSLLAAFGLTGILLFMRRWRH